MKITTILRNLMFASATLFLLLASAFIVQRMRPTQTESYQIAGGKMLGQSGAVDCLYITETSTGRTWAIVGERLVSLGTPQSPERKYIH